MNRNWFLSEIKRRAWLDKEYNQWKAKVKSDAKKEAEEIFIKTQKGVKWDERNYPKVTNSNYNDQKVWAWLTKKWRWEMYGKRAENVEKQVIKTRLEQFKRNKSGK